MSRSRAPTARSRPISERRSMTLAIMMFMMPMPPTSSEMPATADMTMVKMALGLLMLSEKTNRYGQPGVSLAAVAAVQKMLHGVGGGEWREAPGHAQLELGQFALQGGEPQPSEGRVQRQIDAVALAADRSPWNSLSGNCRSRSTPMTLTHRWLTFTN